MDLSIGSIANVHVVTLRGRFTLGAPVDEFRATTDTLMKAGNARFVVCLTEVPTMDSSAIGALIRLMTSSKKLNGDVKLVSPSKMVVQTLKIVGLLNLFEVFDNEQSAAQSFSQATAAPAAFTA